MTLTNLAPARSRSIGLSLRALIAAHLSRLAPRFRRDRIAKQDLPDLPQQCARPLVSSQDAATRLAIRAGVRPGNW